MPAPLTDSPPPTAPTTPKATHEANPFEKLAQPRRARAHKRSATGFIPEGHKQLNEIFPGDPTLWKTSIATNDASLGGDVETVRLQRPMTVNLHSAA
ncbi:Non-essential glycogen phosphorylase [Rhodosporidiobolus nylandii]